MRVLLSLCLLTLTDCALLPTQAKFDERCARWVGKTGDELVSKLGAPQSMMTLDSGGKLYQYTDSSHVYSSEYDQSSRSVATTEAVYGCQVHFITNPKGVIEKYGFSGNNCKAR